MVAQGRLRLLQAVLQLPLKAKEKPAVGVEGADVLEMLMTQPSQALRVNGRNRESSPGGWF